MLTDMNGLEMFYKCFIAGWSQEQCVEIRHSGEVFYGA